MCFPSESLRAWCANIERLRLELAKSPRESHRAAVREDGFCECGVGVVISSAPWRQQAQLCSGLFWSIWIDQVLFTVSPRELYDRFRDPKLYLFPKLYSHTGPGHASPALLLRPRDDFVDERWQYERPSQELLVEDKKDFWGEVAAWLSHVGAENRRQTAEAEFRADLRQRFPAGFEFLFPQ